MPFNPNRYKTQNISEKAVDYYRHALEYVPDCYMTQEM